VDGEEEKKKCGVELKVNGNREDKAMSPVCVAL